MFVFKRLLFEKCHSEASGIEVLKRQPFYIGILMMYILMRYFRPVPLPGKDTQETAESCL